MAGDWVILHVFNEVKNVFFDLGFDDGGPFGLSLGAQDRLMKFVNFLINESLCFLAYLKFMLVVLSILSKISFALILKFCLVNFEMTDLCIGQPPNILSA